MLTVKETKNPAHLIWVWWSSILVWFSFFFLFYLSVQLKADKVTKTYIYPNSNPCFIYESMNKKNKTFEYIMKWQKLTTSISLFHLKS